MEVRKSSVTEIKWNFLLEMNIRTGLLSLGLHKKGSTYDVLNTDDCKLVHKDMTDILTCVRDYFLEKGGTHIIKKMNSIQDICVICF